jgi:hypothetical protein
VSAPPQRAAPFGAARDLYQRVNRAIDGSPRSGLPLISKASAVPALDTCPHCTKPVDPQLHFVRGTLVGLPNYLFGWEWPSERRARKFTVRCPHCAKTYVSRTLRRFGFVTFDNYVTVVAVACAAAVAMVLIGARMQG